MPFLSHDHSLLPNPTETLATQAKSCGTGHIIYDFFKILYKHPSNSYYPIRNIYNRDMCSCSEFLVVKRIKKTCLISDQVVTDEAVLG